MKEAEENQELKCCGRCKVMKPLTEFAIRSYKKYNRLKRKIELNISIASWCKQCHSNYANQKEKEKRATTEHKAIMQKRKNKRKKELQRKRASQPPKPKRKMTPEERDRLNAYKRDRYKHDVQYRLSQLIRSRLRASLKASRTQKRNKTMELIGCDIAMLKSWLESQFVGEMTWENHGKLWEIDHIKPMAAYDLSNHEALKQAMHYTNLRPLESKENHAKNSWFNGMRYRYRRLRASRCEREGFS
jgi:hypothetical protein